MLGVILVLRAKATHDIMPAEKYRHYSNTEYSYVLGRNVRSLKVLPS